MTDWSNEGVLIDHVRVFLKAECDSNENWKRGGLGTKYSLPSARMHFYVLNMPSKWKGIHS
jgi:hypothetical protein